MTETRHGFIVPRAFLRTNVASIKEKFKGFICNRANDQ